jgi:hypothetical protein
MSHKQAREYLLTPEDSLGIQKSAEAFQSKLRVTLQSHQKSAEENFHTRLNYTMQGPQLSIEETSTRSSIDAQSYYPLTITGCEKDPFLE